ncbi:hypothetical protein [Streptomyces sp. NPDC059009]|uniref:hypothetical protein n=1 Tax=Streptomyces sp. NPDC059009 TaxID=3346694 RepID=UPI0036C339F8
MRIRIAFAVAGAAALLALSAAPSAAGGATAEGPRDCGALRLTGSLPAPAPGTAVRQEVTVGADCRPHLGEVRVTPLAAGSDHRLTSWNEMYDCCNIRMTGLYTTSDWTTDGGRIARANTDVTQQWNREPWNAGWSLADSAKGTDCLTDCAVSRTEARARFTYKGIFDTSGNRYENAHHSSIELTGDGTGTCTFDVELKHTFVGWNWQRGCS